MTWIIGDGVVQCQERAVGDDAFVSRTPRGDSWALIIPSLVILAAAAILTIPHDRRPPDVAHPPARIIHVLRTPHGRLAIESGADSETLPDVGPAFPYVDGWR